MPKEIKKSRATKIPSQAELSTFFTPKVYNDNAAKECLRKVLSQKIRDVPVECVKSVTQTDAKSNDCNNPILIGKFCFLYCKAVTFSW